jgi:hypothetical protein
MKVGMILMWNGPLDYCAHALAMSHKAGVGTLPGKLLSHV